MYVEQPLRLGAGRLARLRDLTRSLDLSPGPGGSRMAADCRHLFAADLHAEFPGVWTYATVVALYPSCQLVAHRDPPCQGIRFHLPLVLNDGCWVFHAGTWQQLDEGHAYTMTPTEEHGAVNWGTTTRLHLLIDVN